MLLPPACAGCGRFGVGLCADCVAAFHAPGGADERFLVADPAVVVGEHLVLAVAAFAYDGALRNVLQRVKYASAARVTSALAAAALPSFIALAAISGPATLVPVPLHRERRRERGFNQAALIARAVARQTGLPMREILVRDRATTRQHGLDRAGRLRNLAGAFRHEPREPVAESVIVVDDILTTSATMEACAAVLRAAGSARVHGFAIAREV